MRTKAEQELVVIDNRGDDFLTVSSTHPHWTRKLEAFERRGLARRTRTITEGKDREILGGDWELDRESVALRLSVRRKATEAQRAAAAKGRDAIPRRGMPCPDDARGPEDAPGGTNPQHHDERGADVANGLPEDHALRVAGGKARAPQTPETRAGQAEEISERTLQSGDDKARGKPTA